MFIILKNMFLLLIISSKVIEYWLCYIYFSGNRRVYIYCPLDLFWKKDEPKKKDKTEATAEKTFYFTHYLITNILFVKS